MIIARGGGVNWGNGGKGMIIKFKPNPLYFEYPKIPLSIVNQLNPAYFRSH